MRRRNKPGLMGGREGGALKAHARCYLQPSEGEEMLGGSSRCWKGSDGRGTDTEDGERKERSEHEERSETWRRRDMKQRQG